MESKKFRIAISSVSKGMDSEVDARFGRCFYFVIVELDEEKKEIKAEKTIENKATAYSGGAGSTAAEIVGNENVNAVITGNIGPRAFEVLQKLGIKIYQGRGKIKEVIKKFINNELTELGSASGPMHKGLR